MAMPSPPQRAGGGGGGMPSPPKQYMPAAPAANLPVSTAAPAAKKADAQSQFQDEVVVKGTPVEGAPRDLTTIPNELDAKYLALDTEGTLRPTTIKVRPGAPFL